MVKLYALVFSLLSSLSLLTAQPTYKKDGGATGNNTFALGATSSCKKVQMLYLPSNFSPAPASGAISKVWFMYGSTGITPDYTITNLRINMGQTAATGFSGTNFYTGLTSVLNAASYTVPAGTAGNWFSIDLATPYNYDPGQTLIVEILLDAGSVTNFGTFTGSTVTGQKLYSASTAAATGTANSNLQNFGFDLQVIVCTSPPMAGNAKASPSTPVCSGAPVNLSLQNNTTGVGQDYEWQSGPVAGGPFAAIASAANAGGITVNPTATTWYRAKLTCGSQSAFSQPVEVVVNPALPAGTYTVNNTQPTGGTNFQSFADAINRMGCGIAGNVIFDVSAGQTFNESPEITVQGTLSATVTFRKSGNGANPKISKAGTSATAEYLLKLTGADYITFNGIDFEQTGTSSADWVEYGIFIVNASATNGSQNNVFKNGTVSLSGSSTATRGVFMDQAITSTAASGANSNNRFLNMTVRNAFSGYYLTGSTAAAYPDDDTEIGTEAGGTSRIQNLGDGVVSGSMYAVYGIYQTALKLRNTQITNLQNGGTGLIYAAYFLTAAANSAEISGNTFSNITGGGTVTALYMTAGTSLSVFNNQFSAIRSTTSAATAVRAIDLTATGLTATIHSNRFYDISSAGLTTTTVGAIEVATGLGYTIYNNAISDLRAPASTSPSGSVKGIAVVGGTAGSTVRIYYNTILLTDVATAAAYTSAGIYNSSTVPTLDLQNNLVVNRTNVTTGTRAVAFWKTSATLNLDANTDNNLYYAGTPGPKNLIYYDGTNSAQQLNDYKVLGLSPREANSVTENVAFLPVSSGIVRINPNLQSLAESGGKEIAGIAVDFEGTPRGPYPVRSETNSGGLKPDIGADEYDGRLIDILGPDISFTPLANSALANRTLTATITDVSGVAGGAAGPRLYYRKSGTSVYAVDAAPAVNGEQYTFTVSAAAIGGVIPGDVIEYYVAAQDNNGYGSTLPFGGSGSNPPGTTAPGSPALYRILYSFSGVYTVGASGTYQNLTAIAGLLNSSSEVTGPTVFELQADYDGTTGETFPIQFNKFLTGNPAWTVTIRPAAGVTARTTSGDPGTGNPLVNLNGASRLIFDGRPGGTGTAAEWTFRNTRTAGTVGSVFRFINDAAYDTLRHLVVEGQPTLTTQGLVFFSTSTGTTGNSFNQVANSLLRGRTDVAPTTMSVGIYSAGTATALNSANAVTGNRFVNSSSGGVTLTATGNGPNWLINGNHFYGDLSSTTTQSFISIASDSALNTTVANNYIGGSAAGATGTLTNTGNVAVNAVNITGGRVNILNNTIANIANTNAGTAARTRGINFTSDLGGSVIQGNNIFNLSSMGAVTGYTAGSQAAVGIHYFPADYQSLTVKQNTVYNISIDNTSALTTSNIAAGMVLTNMGGIASENRIYNIRNKTTGTTAGQPPIAAGIYLRFLTGTAANNMVSVGAGETDDVQYTGILVAGGTLDNSAAVNLYHNSVFVGGTATGGNGTYALLRGDNTATTPLQTVKALNNLFTNVRLGGSSNYAVGNQGASASTFWTSNYNVLHSSNATATGLWNATGYDFAGWQTASAGDAASKTLAVNFTNSASADLHLAGASVGNQALTGTPLAGVTVDFDLETRSAARPYIGADEATELAAPLPVRLEYFKGVRQGTVHLLNWKVLCTGDGNRFAVERSADGRAFEMIGEVRASRAECGFELAFTDKAPLPGINYYRLRITDENGRVTYSFVIALINKEVGFEVVSVLPTVATATLWASVSATRATVLDLLVYDGQGRQVKRFQKAVAQGASLVQLDIAGLAGGAYVVKAVAPEGYEKSFRFVKQ